MNAIVPQILWYTSVKRTITHTLIFMTHTDRAAPHLPDVAVAPLTELARLWLYAVTQWRRMFGLNISRVDDLLFVGGEFSAAQWAKLYAFGIRAVLSLQAEREDQFAGPPARALRLAVE